MKKFAVIDEAAIAALVAAFYDKVRRDPVLGPIFERAVEDWDAHLRTLNAFWSSVMLTSGRYKGNPFGAHRDLPIRPCFFGRWLGIWAETADELFEPELADAFVAKAERIAQSLVQGLFFRPDQSAATPGNL